MSEGKVSYIPYFKKIPDSWKYDKHFRSMVYHPYYYVYYDYPYLESKFIDSYNKKYSPTEVYKKKIVLNDGTVIETFSKDKLNPLNIVLLIVVLIVIWTIIYKIR
jgi:hypothetical protein